MSEAAYHVIAPENGVPVKAWTKGVPLEDAARTARHAAAQRRHQVITRSEHHAGIPLGTSNGGKTLVHIQQSAPVIEARSREAGLRGG